MKQKPELLNVPVHIRMEDGSKGPALSTGCTRVVFGGRGAYLEIDPCQIDREQLEIQPEQEYRYSTKWKEMAYYGWLRTKSGHRKVYEQFKYVGYADYLVGYFYIDSLDVFLPEGVPYSSRGFCNSEKDD